MRPTAQRPGREQRRNKVQNTRLAHKGHCEGKAGGAVNPGGQANDITQLDDHRESAVHDEKPDPLAPRMRIQWTGFYCFWVVKVKWAGVKSPEFTVRLIVPGTRVD